MIIFLHGADSYRLTRRLQVLRQAFAGKYGDLNINLLEGGSITKTDDLISSVSAGSLFGSKRLVVVKDLLSENKDKDLLNDLALRIEDGLFAADDGNVLIFYETTARLSNSRLAQLLGKQKAEEFLPLSGGQLSRFVKQMATELQLELETAALGLLVANASMTNEEEVVDLFQIENELKKLAASQSGTITASDVKAVCSESRAAGHIFSFTDYLGQRNSKAALQELAALRNSGKEEAFIFVMVAKHVRNLLIVSDLQKQGLTMDAIAKLAKLHPFVVKKALSQSQRFSVADLAAITRRLLTIDRQQKTGELLDETLALDQLVLDLELA